MYKALILPQTQGFGLVTSDPFLVGLETRLPHARENFVEVTQCHSHDYGILLITKYPHFILFVRSYYT